LKLKGTSTLENLYSYPFARFGASHGKGINGLSVVIVLTTNQECLILRPTTRELFSYAWSTVKWQRWRSHHSIHHGWKPYATRKLHGCMFYRTGVIADRSFTLWE